MSGEGDDGRIHNLTDSTSYTVPISQYESNSVLIKVNMNLAVDFNRSMETSGGWSQATTYWEMSAISYLECRAM